MSSSRVDANFSDAGMIQGSDVFNDATIHSLNLGGDQIQTLGPPLHFDELTIAPRTLAQYTADVLTGLSYKGLPSSFRTNGQRELLARLQQFETAALSAGDLAAANEARVLRLSLNRKNETPVLRALDWAFAWEVGGYLVRPWHPVLALLALFLLGVLVRSVAHRRDRSGIQGVLAGLSEDASGAFRSFRRIKPEGRASLVAIESFAYTLLTVVLLVNLEGVSSSIHQLVQGIV